MSNNFLEELTTLVRKHADPGDMGSVCEIVAGLEIAKASVLSGLIEMAVKPQVTQADLDTAMERAAREAYDHNAPSLCGDGASARPEGQKVSG